MTTVLAPHEYAARKRCIAQFFATNKSALITALEEAQQRGILDIPDGISVEDIVGASIGALALVAEASEESAEQLDDAVAARAADGEDR